MQEDWCILSVGAGWCGRVEKLIRAEGGRVRRGGESLKAALNASFLKVLWATFIEASLV